MVKLEAAKPKVSFFLVRIYLFEKLIWGDILEINVFDCLSI